MSAFKVLEYSSITINVQFGEVLGQGNGGKVVAAVHKATGIPVAVKVSELNGRLASY